MEYLRIALIDEKTYSAQLLLCSCMRSSSRRARGRLSRKFSSMTKNDCTPRLVLHVLHDVEELIAGFVEVVALALAAEERGRGAEVAAHRASDRGNDRGGGIARVVGHAHAKNAEAEAGENFGMDERRAGIFAEEAAHPGNAFAAHDVVGIEHVFHAGNAGDVAADDDGGVRRKLAHAAAHLAHLAEVGNDAGDSDDVVLVRGQFALKLVEGREVEQRARSRDVLLDHHQAPRAVEHAQRKAALLAGDLVVVKLHRIDGAAAELIVLGVGAENGTQKNACLSSLGMRSN